MTSGDPEGSEFKLTLDAENFDAKYTWVEDYHQVEVVYELGSQQIISDKHDEFPYSPHYGKLAVDMTLPFTYNSTDNTYNINVRSVEATPSDVDHNGTPQGSVLNVQGNCFSDQVADITNDAISAIDFGPAIETALDGTLSTIPDSGDLDPDNGISFDFALGKDGLAFPSCNGIQIAVTGVASYEDVAYDGPNKPTLPIPAVPADNSEDHINIYVSDWAINGLNWAYCSAGLLDLTLHPEDLPNPDVLKTDTYADMVPSFKQYGRTAMTAYITPQEAPFTEFQTVYLFTSEVMTELEDALPQEVYRKLDGYRGDGFVSEEDLFEELTTIHIDEQYFQTIAEIAQQRGMVTTQNVLFQLDIETGEDVVPNLIFDLVRTDIMTNLELGIAPESDAQTMQFGFTNASSEATFRSSTVPGFEEEGFGVFIWPVVGETKYAETMVAMGKTGVPIPIAEGFQFLFSDARLNIEEGYVSISSKVEFKPESLPPHVAKLWIPLQKVNRGGGIVADFPAA